MKTLNWNSGVLIIRLGYHVRKHQEKPNYNSIRWAFGRIVLMFGYLLRGEIPMKRWEINHV